MCGIAGIYGGKVDKKAEQIVRRMLGVIEHRGPDGTRVELEATAVLGHHRLSIIDLSDAASQPMVDATGRYVLTYNGEIFNYVELRAELEQQGHSFSTSSDSEVLLKAFTAWGDDFLNRLNGMFAFAIYDRTTSELFCARDRLGVKPFVYAWDGTRFAFASEHKALIAGGVVSAAPNSEAVYEYIARGYTTGGRSFYEGIESLEPGHAIRVGPPGLKRWRWWRPITNPYERFSFHDWAERVSFLVDDAVRIRLRSDVPVGAHLSGGLDSSAIAGASARHLAGLMTFTGAFSDDPASDERRYSRLVNSRFGLVGREVELRVDDLAASFDRLLWHLDEPVAGPGAFPQLHVCDLAAANGVKVVLGGQGGDELFGGYLRHRAVFYKSSLRRGGLGNRAEAGFTLARLAAREWRRVRRTATRIPDAQLDPVLLAALDPDFKREVRSPALESGSARELMRWDLLNYLPALLQVEDRTSMAASIESRTPLLDYRLVELMLRVPDRHLFHPEVQKPLLRAAVSRWTPPEILARRDKLGFPTPLHLWRQRPKLQALVESVLGPAGRGSGSAVFSSDYLDRRESFAPSELWTVLTVQGWLNRVEERPPAAVAV